MNFFITVSIISYQTRQLKEEEKNSLIYSHSVTDMFPEERDTGSFKAAKYNQSLLLSTHKQFGLLSSSERREKSAILGFTSRCSEGGNRG